MGILEALKRTFNIGGAKIEILAGSSVFPQGGEIKGQLLIKCGNYEISGNSITMLLEEFWQERRGSGKNSHTVTVRSPHGKITFADRFTLDSGMEYAYPFSFKLPLNSRLSTSSTGWSLMVVLDVPKAFDPEKRIILKVGPAKEFLAVSEALQRQLNFKEKPKSWRWDKSTSATYFRLIPAEDLQKEFDYIAFELLQEYNGGVSGTVIFDLQEKFLKDYFKAIVDLDWVRQPFKLERSELYREKGSFNYEFITQKLNTYIRKIIAERDPYNKV
ncbi:MAG: hypothetical protein A2X48_09525 [Lentisphaerae bacterium GWF2_49_21]|nr:MAG: hypothetical protein A2X48_09525 [Lentisphaerae bacterium GWF2_49_21]